MAKTVLNEITPLCSTFPDSLKSAKQKSDDTYATASEATGVSEDSLAKFFSGRTNPTSFWNIVALCKHWHFSIDEHFGITAKGSLSAQHELELRLLSAEKDLHESAQICSLLRAQLRFRTILIYFLLFFSVVLSALCVTLDLSNPSVGLFNDTASPSAVWITFSLIVLVIVTVSAILLHRGRKK